MQICTIIYIFANRYFTLLRMDDLTKLLIIALIILLAFTAIILYEGLMARKRNIQMVETIRHLTHYRDLALHSGNETQNKEAEFIDSDLELLKLFKSVDKRIEKELLFTDPNFGRENLMRLFSTDKNNLPNVLQRFADTNVTGYINAKRMDYAVQLLKEHPEYTLGAISEACGIKSPATFIRNFKNTFGMAPSDYRKALEEITTTPPHKINVQ